MTDYAVLAEMNTTIDQLVRMLDDLDVIAGELDQGRPSDLSRINAAQRRARVLLSKVLVSLDRLDPSLRQRLQEDRARRVA